MADVLIGMEVLNLGMPHENAPSRMIVDVWDSQRQTIVRYQITGHLQNEHAQIPERKLEDIARFQPDWERRDEIARELDRLDREAAKR